MLNTQRSMRSISVNIVAGFTRSAFPAESEEAVNLRAPLGECSGEHDRIHFQSRRKGNVVCVCSTRCTLHPKKYIYCVFTSICLTEGFSVGGRR